MDDSRRRPDFYPATFHWHPDAGSPAPASVVVAVLAEDAHEADVQGLLSEIKASGLGATLHLVGPRVLVVNGSGAGAFQAAFAGHPALARIFVPDTRYRLARRDVNPAGSVVYLGGVPFGGPGFPVVAGPCSVEDLQRTLDVARAVRTAGASVLRGGAFKPRTSPYDFQGLGLRGVEMLIEVRAATGLPFVTEAMSAEMVTAMYEAVDGYQVGARNMQNFDLLKALAEVDKPVLLKRGPAATVEEWLLAAEYLLAGGNPHVILCERGIRAFNAETRFTLDLASMALAKSQTHLPVIVDPSHATGDPSLIAPMARAALAAGADGLMVEVHASPDQALSDGFQALRPRQFAAMMDELRALAPVLGRTVAPARQTGAELD